MKIVFFTDFYRPSLEGVTASVTLFAHALRAQGHRVYIVAPAPARPIVEDHPDVIRFPSIPSVWHKGLRDGILTSKMQRILKDLKPDIYHFHTNGPTGLAGMRVMFELGIPAVATYHTDYEQYAKIYPRMWAGLLTGSLLGPLFVNKTDAWPESLAGIKPKRSIKAWNDSMVQNVIRMGYEYFGRVIVPSKKMGDALLSYGVTRPIDVLPTGINPADFENLHPAPKNIDHQPTIIYVGRIAREKNIDILLDALIILRKRKVGARLRFVGPGPYMSRFRQRVRDSHLEKYVTFDGGISREHALQAYQEADFFGFPSLTDTQAIVLNEAAYSKLPLLYSDPNISLVAQDGVSGYCLPPTGEAYADAIEKLIAKPALRRKLGAGGRQLAETLTIDKQAKQLVAIYRKTIRSGWRPSS